MCEREARLTEDDKLTVEKLKAKAEIAGLEWAEGKYHGKTPGLFLRCPCGHCAGHAVHLAASEIPTMHWRQIYEAVIGGRHVEHVSRIVGYYSRVENWNPSKKSELHDRQKGTYSVK